MALCAFLLLAAFSSHRHASNALATMPLDSSSSSSSGLMFIVMLDGHGLDVHGHGHPRVSWLCTRSPSHIVALIALDHALPHRDQDAIRRPLRQHGLCYYCSRPRAAAAAAAAAAATTHRSGQRQYETAKRGHTGTAGQLRVVSFVLVLVVVLVVWCTS
jgi:hypothetical protein